MSVNKILRRSLLGVVVSPVLVLISAGAASAATLSADPDSVSAGGAINIEGDGWIGTVSLSFKKQSTVIPVVGATTGPNGGSINVTRSVPNEAGIWELCAQGNTLPNSQSELECVDVTVTATATTTAAPTTTKPPTSTTKAPTTTTAPTTTSPSTTVVESTTSAPVTTVTPASLAPVDLPLGPDGTSDVEEETISTDGSGLSGLTIGVMAGIVVLTAVAVIALAGSDFGTRRPRTAVAVGIVGLLLAGGSAIVMPPPKVNVPKLNLSRVQTTVSLARGSTLRTITAECPSGEVVVGGGFASNWDSTSRTDSDYMVKWLESETRNAVWAGSNTFVLSFNVTQVISTVGSSMPTPPSGVAAKYWNATRIDGTAHLSDQVWDSKQESANSANQRNQRTSVGQDPGPPTFIPRSDAVVAASADYFYILHDAQAPTKADLPGLHVTQSKPEGSSWTVTAALSEFSLMPKVSVTVVAVCAPDANNTDEPGVIGAHVVGEEGQGSASCPSGEVVTSVGWSIAPPGYVRAVMLSGSKVEVEGGSAYAVCAQGRGLAVSTGAGTVEAKMIREGSGNAACPTGSYAFGGALTATYTNADGGVLKDLPQNVVGAAPVGNGFSVTMRGMAANWPKAKAGAIGVDVDNVFQMFSYDQYDKIPTSSAEITSICGRRVP